MPDDTHILFTNTAAENGYPIAGFAWMLVYENLDQNNVIQNRNEAEELIEFLIWSITDGQDLSELLGFARIPDAALEKDIGMIREIKSEGEEIGLELLQQHNLI